MRVVNHGTALKGGEGSFRVGERTFRMEARDV
jgi:hypothetical protein